MVNEKEAMGLLTSVWDFTTWIDENYPEVYDEYVKQQDKQIKS